MITRTQVAKAAVWQLLFVVQGATGERVRAASEDMPFLECVGNPVAVNPDRELRRIAAARGWPVLRVTAGAA